MLISQNLLALLLPKIKNFTVSEISQAFMLIGIEVENFYKHKPINEIYFGYVHKVKKHPKSNKLLICDVELSNKVFKKIVCGAQNVRAGLKVVVVQNNAVLPSGLKISPKKILGVVSDGMICSYYELKGIDKSILSNNNDDTDGIIELDDDFNFYQKFDPNVIGLDDTVFDLSIPSNRSDLHCAFGLVIELSQKLNLHFKIDSYKQLITNINSLEKDQSLIVHNNLKTNNAAFFLHLDNIKIKNSSWKIKSILLNNNFGSINQLVDLGNLIAILFNQPIHFHDVKKIAQKTLKIDFANNQKFEDLNQKKYQLSQNEIIIEDGDHEVVALGGIIGSNKTKIDLTTEKAYFELINFNYLPILKTNINYSINSASALSNSKKKSNYLSFLALNFAIENLQKICNVKIAYAKYKLEKKNKIDYDYEWLRKFLGFDFDSEYVQTQLMKLGFSFNHNILYPPIWRNDLINNNDLCEEVVNILDVDKISAIAPLIKIDFNNHTNEFESWTKVRQYLINKNFYEAKTYNLQDANSVSNFNFCQIPIFNSIKNFSSVLRTTMRVHAIKELLNVIINNFDNQNSYQSWFELFNIYWDNHSYQTLNLVAVPNQINSPFNNTKLSHDLYDLKTYISEIFKNLEQEIKFKIIDNSYQEFNNVFVAENTAAVFNQEDEFLGYIGQLNLPILKAVKWNLKIPCYGCFVWLQQNKPKNKIAPTFSEYPSSFKNYSFQWNNSKIYLADLIKAIKKVDNVVNVKLMEKYIDENQKTNYLIQVRINNLSKTLTSYEINCTNQAIVDIFVKNNLILR